MKNFYVKLESIKKNPYMVFIMAFAVIIFIGAILLNLPISNNSGKSIGFVDALFTSTSAMCVTGLTVVNTAEYWTNFGKIVILILIQMGGLGVMTMSAMISFFLGKKITLKTRVFIMEERNVDELQGVVRLTKSILVYTFLIEFIGAVLLSFVFIKDYGIGKGIAFSIFHSISAFCNAGFDITGNSMMNYVNNPIITFAISLLVIIGGIGYFVFWDIYDSKGFRRLSLHSKLVLIITGVLLILGFVFVLILEYNNSNTLGNLSILGKIQASIFQSVVPRTAGFNSLDIASLRIPTVVLMLIFMFVGGSSGSTAGGVKITTVGVIIISIYNFVRGKRDVEVFMKRIEYTTIIKAVSIVGIGMLLINGVTFILTITEVNSGFDFLDILFETVSSFGTVGLSRGLTPSLSDVGRIILSVVMFIGRLGPLTVALAFMKRHKNKGNYTYPEGKIIVG
ncbi:trk system potassium uptake protein TrkH [Sedimentibacter acidaminivorans]|uniref:Trk system potassium uptake protein TrkH n=1 Tax=Sedimentibacter acidaminivorans TaxID=913099 RepID=A0ABS4G939_9FIRM|nr:TrkH family potassium uptake protein [Sedimentibacter acidaminivorans]MBP1924193.1 trk system potassium uptake protein TrkH [Sedimentibacter acidaminivorans]